MSMRETAQFMQVVPNSRRPYLYRGACEFCGRVASPDHPLIARIAVADAIGITPDTMWKCVGECAAPKPERGV
jgi:hypothetical protein